MSSHPATMSPAPIKPATVPGRHFLGNMGEFNSDTPRFLRRVLPLGDLVRFRFGPFWAYVANSPDIIHAILVEQANVFRKSPIMIQVLEPAVGQGLFTSQGDLWKRQRKLMQPVFHARRIGDYARLMVDFTDEAMRRWQSGETRDIDKDMTAITMRIIAKTLFDADVDKEAGHVGEVITEIFHVVENKFKQIIPLPYWLPLRENFRMRRAVRSLDEVIQRFIEERRRTGEDKGDFLSLLLAARDEDNTAMTDKQVRDEAMTLFGAGHETTAVTLTWTWYLLAKHPEIAAKLHEELDRVLGGRLPTLEDLPQLTYTEMVIKESMRLFPAAWGVTRQSTEATRLGQYEFPKESLAIVNIYGVHRDARYFPEPDRFMPERFSPEREKSIPKYAYLPFGGGPRVCIGNAFSLMESRLMLATIASRFEVSLAPGFDAEPTRMFTLRPKNGMKVVLKARKS